MILFKAKQTSNFPITKVIQLVKYLTISGANFGIFSTSISTFIINFALIMVICSVATL